MLDWSVLKATSWNLEVPADEAFIDATAQLPVRIAGVNMSIVSLECDRMVALDAEFVRSAHLSIDKVRFSDLQKAREGLWVSSAGPYLPANWFLTVEQVRSYRVLMVFQSLDATDLGPQTLCSSLLKAVGLPDRFSS